MNHLLYVYMDESGDLGKFGSKFFTVAAILVKDPIELSRIIKKVRQKKLKKTMKQLPEVKANNSDVRTREFVLKGVQKANCSIFAIVVEKNQIMKHLFDIKNKLYNYLCGVLMKRLPLDCKKLEIVIDKKHTNTLLQEDFNKYIISKINQTNKDMSIEIFHKDSFSSNGLQVIDFIVWAISRKFNAGDDYYYKLFESKITNKEDMNVWK